MMRLEQAIEILAAKPRPDLYIAWLQNSLCQTLQKHGHAFMRRRRINSILVAADGAASKAAAR